MGLARAYIVAGFALQACASGSGLRVERSQEFGADRVAGMLRVIATEARLEGGGRVVRLVQAPPQTAESLESLLGRTASALRHLEGRRVEVRGELQGDLLWSADVEDPGP